MIPGESKGVEAMPESEAAPATNPQKSRFFRGFSRNHRARRVRRRIPESTRYRDFSGCPACPLKKYS